MTDDGGATIDVREVHDFVCTACACACDDLTLRVGGERVLSFEPPCPLAAPFLLVDRAELPAVGLEEAISRAAALLRSAQAPLVMGLERTTDDAQWAAIGIADRLGAVIGPTDVRGRSQSHLAAQIVGADPLPHLARGAADWLRSTPRSYSTITTRRQCGRRGWRSPSRRLG